MRTHPQRASEEDPGQEADYLRYGYVLLAAPHGAATWTDHGLRCAARAVDHMRHAIAVELFIRDVAGTAS